MKKKEFSISEEKLATEIIDLHNQGLGFRRIAQVMSNKGFPMSKDTAHRIYWKYKPKEQDVEVEDKEVQSLMTSVIKAQKRLYLLRKKTALKKQLVDLRVNQIMESHEKRKKIFSDKKQLLKFANMVMPFLNPQLWQDIQDYCVEEDEISSMVAEALGEQKYFEQQLKNENDQKQRLDTYLEEKLIETLNYWTKMDTQELQKEDEVEITETPDGDFIITFPKPPNQFEME